MLGQRKRRKKFFKNLFKKRKKKRFYWRAPKNMFDFFDPHYDDKFKARHPFLYGLTVILIIAGVMIGPLLFNYICDCYILPFDTTAVDAIFRIIGFLASFAFSVSIENVFMALYNQYLGHVFTLASLAVGVIIPALCLQAIWLL